MTPRIVASPIVKVWSFLENRDWNLVPLLGVDQSGVIDARDDSSIANTATSIDVGATVGGGLTCSTGAWNPLG